MIDLLRASRENMHLVRSVQLATTARARSEPDYSFTFREHRMKKILSIGAATLMLCATSTVFADSGDKQCSKESCSKAACSKTASTGSCPVSEALADLPELTFTVGDKALCCEQSANAVAKESNSKVQYLVAKKAYDNKDEAMVALADATEEFVAEFATPHTCSVSGQTTVAGTSTSCSVTAGKLASITKEAMSEVTLAYKVGDEQCSCPTQAASLAKSSGKAKQFVIGNETTSCSVDARIKLARAKYEAAVKALAKAEPNEEAPKS
jgi:hypothetical protein